MRELKLIWAGHIANRGIEVVTETWEVVQYNSVNMRTISCYILVKKNINYSKTKIQNAVHDVIIKLGWEISTTKNKQCIFSRGHTGNNISLEVNNTKPGGWMRWIVTNTWVCG